MRGEAASILERGGAARTDRGRKRIAGGRGVENEIVRAIARTSMEVPVLQPHIDIVADRIISLGEQLHAKCELLFPNW